MSASTLRLFLDLGDLFTKVVAVRGAQSKRARLPSVIAHDLLEEGPAAQRLRLYAEEALVRPESRLRSFPGQRRLLEAARSRGHPAEGARFAGRMAVLYGADRTTLGQRCDEEVIDALVHKALLKTATGTEAVVIDYLIDGGPKSAAIERYAARPRQVEMNKWRLRHAEPERLCLSVTGCVVDTAPCLLHALSAERAPSSDEPVLLVDIGYARTRLWVMTAAGCAMQQELDGLGFDDCIRRVVRDGQEQGLDEDEFAVIWALERGDGFVQIAGRQFDVRPVLDRAAESLIAELGRGVQRTLLAFFSRHTLTCRTVALVGGGAAYLGTRLADHIRALDLGIDAIWRAPDPGFAAVEGARRRALDV